MNEKIEKYIKIKNEIKELDEVAKLLAKEIAWEIKEKVYQDWYIVQKVSKITYSAKKDIDLDMVREKYPVVIKEKIDWKLLYQLADNPDELVTEKHSEYLDMRKEKVKELDF